MDWYIVVIIAAGVLALFVALTTLASALIVHNFIMGHRQDKIPGVKYFTFEDFALKSEPLEVNYNGINLYSQIYFTHNIEECEKVVIFQHGFGAGSSSYVTEIAYLAGQGFAVVATDAYGCNNSQGKNIKGFYAGAEAVIATYIAVKKHHKLKDKKVVLAGHSWGAYSVLAASCLVAAEGVVALSGFNSPVRCLYDNLVNAGGAAKFTAPFVVGWLRFINFCRFGKRGNLTAKKAVQKSGAKTLLIQGEKDRVVPIKHSAAKKVQSPSAQKLILKDKYHNPYNTVAGEKKLAELMGPHNFTSEQQAKEYLDNFDWRQATEEDEEVMTQITSFIHSC